MKAEHDPGQPPPRANPLADENDGEGPIETANIRARSDLMTAVQKAVAGWGLTQAEAARRLEVTQPRLNHLMRGRVRNFSLDALYLLAIRAGLGVHVQIEHEKAIPPGTAERPIPAMTPA